MSRAAGLALAAVVLVPASAGAGTARPPLALTATPAHVALDRLRPGVDPRHEPRPEPGRRRRRTRRILARPARAAEGRRTRRRPSRGVVARRASGAPRAPAGGSRSLTVSSRLPGRTEPGDHDALVLLTTRPRRVRASPCACASASSSSFALLAGSCGDWRCTTSGLVVRAGARILELLVVNRGNMTETLGRGRVQLSLQRGAARTRGSAPKRVSSDREHAASCNSAIGGG